MKIIKSLFFTAVIMMTLTCEKSTSINEKIAKQTAEITTDTAISNSEKQVTLTNPDTQEREILQASSPQIRIADAKQENNVIRLRKDAPPAAVNPKETKEPQLTELDANKKATTPHVQTEITTTNTENELKISQHSTLPSHEIWNTLLSTYVSSTGVVNYSGLKNKEAKLDEYLNVLSSNTPTSSWPRNEAKAYWLNAYNAFTVKLILSNYPVSSITKIHGGKPWDVEWIKLGNKTFSLNHIEHKIIRPTYQDARIHFAVNCAAKSCPPLYNKAFEAANLSGTLTALTKAFINNKKYNNISSEGASVSKIFEWYKEDFGDLRTYINKYSNTQITEQAPISFQEYNWKLNNK